MALATALFCPESYQFIFTDCIIYSVWLLTTSVNNQIPFLSIGDVEKLSQRNWFNFFFFFFYFPPQTAMKWDSAYPKSWKKEEEKEHILRRKSYLEYGGRGSGSSVSYPTTASFHHVTVCKSETIHWSNSHSLAEKLAALAQKEVSEGADATQPEAIWRATWVPSC